MIKFLDKLFSKEWFLKFIRKQISKNSNQLLNRMRENRGKNYSLYKYILSFISDKHKTEDAIYFIVNFLNNRYDDHQQYLTYMFSTLTDVFVFENKIYLYTYRPGLFIGKGGLLVEDMQKELSKKLEGNYTIDFVEDNTSARFHIASDLRTLNSYF